MKLFSGGGTHTGKGKPAGRETPDQPERKMGKGKLALIIVLSILLVLVLAIIAFLKFYVRPPEAVPPDISVTTVDPDTGEQISMSPHSVGDKSHKDHFYNVLLAGTDYDGTRTDTIMIARLDTEAHTVALMSIPRDTVIKLGGRSAKLNSVYGAYGCGTEGMEALMLEVEKIVGFLPTGYILVDLNAFVELVNVVGGVYFNVPQRMYYEDPTQNLYIDLYAGYQLLDGNHAMQLVRYRSYAAADIQRTKVQQDFMKALAKQCLAMENLGKVGDYADILSRNVTTNFTTGNLLFFAQEIARCDMDNMESYTLPGDPIWIDGSYYRLRQDEVDQIVKQSFYPYMEE